MRCQLEGSAEQVVAGRLGALDVYAARDVMSHTAEFSPIHVFASASVLKWLMWFSTPWRSVISTYKPETSFSWIGSNFV
jgi:hypothetical protein